MRQCLQEGELRAWLDGELPAGEKQGVEQHLAECAKCAASSREISARAARVSAWMESLSPDIRMPAAAPRRRWVARPAVWAGAAALAAGLVLAVLATRPPKGPVEQAVAPPPVRVAAPEVQVATPAAAVSTPVAARVRRPPVRKARQVPVQYYMALDEEPIDTGLVMRVALPSGLQADVIVDADGRARAIRPISVTKEEQ